MLDKEIAEKKQAIVDATVAYDEQAAQNRKERQEERQQQRPGRGGYGSGRGNRGGRGRGNRGGRGGAEKGAQETRMGRGFGRDDPEGVHEGNAEFVGYDDDEVYKQAPRPAT